MPLANPITILLAEDHTVVRQGIRALLRLERSFRVVGEAPTGRSAVKLAKALRPDVILMDIAMPEFNGYEATRQIIEEIPDARVLVLSAYGDDAQVDAMIAAGVAGFLNKQICADTLVEAINEVANGKVYLDPAVAKRLRGRQRLARGRNGSTSAKAVQLSPRESEVLELVAGGSHNKQIGEELGISIKTVEKHRQTLMDKLGIHETAGLTRYAIEAGIRKRTV